MSQGEAQVKRRFPTNPLAAKEHRDRKRTKNQKSPPADKPTIDHLPPSSAQK